LGYKAAVQIQRQDDLLEPSGYLLIDLTGGRAYEGGRQIGY
jgi:hypothetical protein